MKCPNCNAVFNFGHICPECGADIEIFKKINSISNKLYNDGLEKAKASDLSGAVLLLNKSILFNKLNIDARNLLGLVYCEMGQLGLAAKHWVISVNFQKENNAAQEYIDWLKITQDQ